MDRECKSGLKSRARQGKVRILESYAPGPWFKASPDEILRELHFAFVRVYRGPDRIVRRRCYMMLDIEKR